MTFPRTEGEPDIDILLDGEALAHVLLDEMQDAFPWYDGTLVEGPALGRWREFVDVYHRADVELDYCPHHPDEGPYEETDLAKYVAVLTALHAARVAGRPVASDSGDDAGELDLWIAPWLDAPADRLREYIDFLDWRRWRAVYRDGTLVEGIALPPSLDFGSRRFAYRP